MNVIEKCSSVTPSRLQGYKETPALWCSDGRHVYDNNQLKFSDEINKAIAQLFIDGATARSNSEKHQREWERCYE